MSSSNLIRLSGLVAVLGGVLFLVAELLSFATETEDFRRSEWANTTPYLFTWSLFLLSGVLLQIGLVGLYLRQSEAGGMFGLVGFVAAFLGTALVLGVIWSQLFIVPDLGPSLPWPTPRGCHVSSTTPSVASGSRCHLGIFSFGLVFVRFCRSENPGLPASGRHSSHSRGVPRQFTCTVHRNRP